MTILNFYDHGLDTFVWFRYGGRNYTRRCNLDGYSYTWKFKRKVWKARAMRIFD